MSVSVKLPRIQPPEAHRLMLVRHAKAMPHDGSSIDFDRPLSEKGKADAEALASILADAGLEVDSFISSPAKRAFSTAKAFADALGAQSIGIDERLYDASPETLLKIVRSLQDKHHSVMIVGHNPALTELAFELCPEIDSELPVCAVACIDIDSHSWDNVKTASGRLSFLISAKAL